MKSEEKNKKVHFLEPSVYDNKLKIFDIKFNPKFDILGSVDLAGKLKLCKIKEEKFE